MRLLFLTNFYPPLDLGGWEQWCQETADAMRERGHEVEILTSRYEAERAPAEAHVHRCLFLESDVNFYRPWMLFLLPWRDRYNRRCLQKMIRRWQPDGIVIWGMWQLSPHLAALAERMRPGRTAYYLCGYWPIDPDPHAAYWQRKHDNVLIDAVKGAVSRLVLPRLLGGREQPRLRNVACVSEAVRSIIREGGVPLPGARVIYGGVDLERFYGSEEREGYHADRPLRLLYAGSLIPAKGVDTAIEAMVAVAGDYRPEEVHLTLVGGGHPHFENALRRRVREGGIGEYVSFRGRVPKEEMAEVVRHFDVLLFTSRWEEPLARMMMEALAAGLVVVGTTTGGTGEVLQDGVNGLTFPPGDAEALTAQIRRLLERPGLVSELSQCGRQTARERLDFDRMIDELESFLFHLVESGGRDAPV
ncbi:MAG: glycosyltransferase family 4 protein [Candidatus Promineifilaceae bacterium]|nr:glycosyltransferase family 4 protein [Candidatus Promineifilaceae bacterium]